MRLSRFKLCAVLAALAAGLVGAAPSPPPASRPSLIVFILVDQFLPDYLEHYAPQLEGGLGRLYRRGAVFTNATQDHAITETAPGHSVTLSGRFPRSTGISSNSNGVDDPDSPLVEGAGAGASPRRFRGTVLIDWLIAADRRSRALSVSMKDRGAILPLGRAKQNVFWYSTDGLFTTSRYYGDSLPAWVHAFNGREVPRRAAGHAWTLLLGPDAYTEPDSVPVEGGGTDYWFPHVLPTDSAQAASLFRGTPWMDQLTLELALEGLRRLRLGEGPATDLLSISLSATDVIGHRYGRDSREIHDQILHLDRYLGAFFDTLFTLRDSSRIIVALTADHGVAHFPELVAQEGAADTPRHVDVREPMVSAREELLGADVSPTAIGIENGVVFLDRRAFKGKSLAADSVIARLANGLRAVPGVARVDRWGTLANQDTVSDYIARRWLHMFPPSAPVELVVTLTPGSVWGNVGIAFHGTPYDYDAHVPMILFGPAFKAGQYADPVRVVDLAPTLARVAGVKPQEPVDGRILREALR